MRIAFYMPMKPLGAPNPSGDLAIGAGLFDFLRKQGHDVRLVSRLRSRFIYWRPWQWPGALAERGRAVAACRAFNAQAWLTFHAYYKAPDVLGPVCAHALGIPYVIFKAAYATKYRKRLATWPGFVLNRASLLAAEAVFANKRDDVDNLRRLLPEERIYYVRPGVDTAHFVRDEAARERLRTAWGTAWGTGDTPVVLAAAMFREDVKAESLLALIAALGQLARRDVRFRLVLAGDGPARPRIEAAAAAHLPGRYTLLGQVTRDDMPGVYSAADVFAFPGKNEALGMVYLEAQACGLPVVAWDGWGVPEVVDHGSSGLLTPAGDEAALAVAVERLLGDEGLRRRMGRAGAQYVRSEHDLNANMAVFEENLHHVVDGWREA